jgi:hypothetical protein
MKDLDLFRMVCLAGALVAAGCSRSSDKVTIDLRRPSQGTPVATFAGGAITVEELNKMLAGMPPTVRLRYQSPAQKKELIERLARMDLLARESVARGHASDPDVVETLKNVLAQKLLKEEGEKALSPPDEELQAWYDSHGSDYTRPETWRVSTLFLAAPESNPAKVASQTAKADKLLAQAQKLKPDDFAGFGLLVKANSDDPSKALEGDLRALTVTELTNRYGPEVAKAVQGLQKPGDLSGVVHARTGLHLLKLRVHTPATQASFAEVKGQIRTRLTTERRNQAFDKFVSDLKTKANFTLDEAALAKVLVDANQKGDEAPGPRATMPAPLPGPPPGPAPARQ